MKKGCIRLMALLLGWGMFSACSNIAAPQPPQLPGTIATPAAASPKPVAEIADTQPAVERGGAQTPEKPAASGEVTGKVVLVGENDIILNLDGGGTYVFMLTHIYNVDAKPGDIVKVVYSGELSDSPEALEIAVQSSEKPEEMINGV
ncbi:MAG: hypothetical protein PHC80_09065, partial [Eubacteriales bacterium]|nr:hypothetical protein [Eubacteriales bacterium]